MDDNQNLQPPTGVPTKAAPEPVSEQPLSGNHPPTMATPESAATFVDQANSNSENIAAINAVNLNNTMEVHHHPNLHHKAKPWKEYVLEFIMIFLAVTLGFFAENIREHFVEKKKERDMIVSFKAELRKDTARLQSNINAYYLLHNQWTDSLSHQIKSGSLKGNERKILLSVVNATVWKLYVTPEIALNILKNSGYFNLIESNELKSEILAYDGIVKGYTNYSNFMGNVQHSMDTSVLALYSMDDAIAAMTKMYLAGQKSDQLFITETDLPTRVEFKTYDQAVFVSFLRKIEQINLLLSDMNLQYRFILEEEIKLLNLIEKEYPNR